MHGFSVGSKITLVVVCVCWKQIIHGITDAVCNNDSEMLQK
jgi:hypothetical protein